MKELWHLPVTVKNAGHLESSDGDKEKIMRWDLVKRVLKLDNYIILVYLSAIRRCTNNCHVFIKYTIDKIIYMHVVISL